uniref:Uncharacterized protein n=1 Tax=Brassica campestris TaxID=3711 RepID=M4DLZ4_BRACM
MEQQRHSLSSLPMLSRLEHLDFVICLELESSSASSTSTGGSGETSSQRIKRDLTKTLPIFSSNIDPFHIPLQHSLDPRETEEKIEEEEKEEEEEEEEEVINIEKPLLEKKDANETCKPNKKKTKSSKKWSWFNLLGC